MTLYFCLPALLSVIGLLSLVYLIFGILFCFQFKHLTFLDKNGYILFN